MYFALETPQDSLNNNLPYIVSYLAKLEMLMKGLFTA